MIFAKVTQAFDGMDGKKVRTFKPGMTLTGELAQTAIDNNCGKEITGAAAKKLQDEYDRKAKAKKGEAAGDDSSVSGDTGSVEEVARSEGAEEAEEETDEDDPDFDEIDEVVDEGGEEAEEVEEVEEVEESEPTPARTRRRSRK